MVEKKEFVPTPEQLERAERVRSIIAASITELCTCSTAVFAPDRLAGAAIHDRVSIKTAEGIAERFASCEGCFEVTKEIGGEEITVKMCHYPGFKTPEVAEE